MASGKSVIGKRLAGYLNLPFYDLDEYIVRECGMSIAEIFRQKGESHFRKTEHELLKQLINIIPKQSVLSVGGGTPCFHENMDLLTKTGLTVYLDATITEIMRNLRSETPEHRPLVLINNLGQKSSLERHMRERASFYALSHLKVPLKSAKNPDLLTKALILFTTTHPDLNYLHEFP